MTDKISILQMHYNIRYCRDFLADLKGRAITLPDGLDYNYPKVFYTIVDAYKNN